MPPPILGGIRIKVLSYLGSQWRVRRGLPKWRRQRGLGVSPSGATAVTWRGFRGLFMIHAGGLVNWYEIF